MLFKKLCNRTNAKIILNASSIEAYIDKHWVLDIV